MLQSYDPPAVKPKAKSKAKVPRVPKPKVSKEKASTASKKKQTPAPMDTSEAYAAFTPLVDDDIAPDPFDCWGGFDEPMNAEVCHDDDNRSTTSDGYTDSHTTTVFSDDGVGDDDESCDSPTPECNVRFFTTRSRGSSAKPSRHVLCGGPRVVEEDDSGIF